MRQTDKSLQSEKFKQVVGGLGRPQGKSPSPDRIQSPQDLDRSFPCWPGSGYFGTASGGVLSTAEGPRPFQLWEPRPPHACAQGGRQRGGAAHLPPQPLPASVVYQRQAQRTDSPQDSAHAQTVPPRPPKTTAAARKSRNTHDLPPVMQCGRQRRWRPLRSTRARRLLSRAVTAAAGDDGGRRNACGCAQLLSRRKTGHSAGANAPGAATSPTNGPQEGFCRKRDRSRRSRSATTLPLRRQSHRGPQDSCATVLDGLAGGTTPPCAPKTGGRPRSYPRSGEIGRPPLLPVTLRAQQATPSVTLRSTCGLPGPRASINRHSASCATCGARSAVCGGRPIEGVAGGVHGKSASDQ